MYQLLVRIARPRLLVLLFALLIGLFIIFRGVQGNIAHLPDVATSVAIPDAQFYYSEAQLVANLDSLGHAGRAIYSQLHLIDTAIPLGYGLLFALHWGQGRTERPNDTFRKRMRSVTRQLRRSRHRRNHQRTETRNNKRQRLGTSSVRRCDPGVGQGLVGT